MNWRFLSLKSVVALLIPIMLMAAPVTLDEIALAIRSGNASALARYFDKSVEITIMNNEQVYSRTQAEMVIKNFFSKYPPQSFDIVHKGSSGDDAKYGIGSLVTRNGSFRTYIYIKQKNNAYFIQELRFEKD